MLRPALATGTGSLRRSAQPVNHSSHGWTTILADRPNPLKLNPLQLKTLALLQLLAGDESFASAPDEAGAVLIHTLPRPHGNHFHIGGGVVLSKDATGLFNPAVYGALSRKCLVQAGPGGMPVLLPAGRAYDTGIRREIVHGADH